MIRIGVSGHRVLADVEKIEAAIELALRKIEERSPAERLSVISALAEGADRLVASHVLSRPGAELIVSLPLSEADYMRDFSSDISRAEFGALMQRATLIVEMPVESSREGAYEAAGKYVLDNSDVLMTVWDGLASQGRGGTADIVSLARQRRLPLAWIHAGNRNPVTQEPMSLGSYQGHVTFENF